MATETEALSTPISFETHPDRYKHWKLSFDGPTARLEMAVDEDAGLRPGYQLKLNSYDLSVDIELQDAVQRLRFEHPEVRCVIVTGGLDRVFCAGANIHMLGMSSHGFKVNFCKFTNETRLSIEDASERSGQRYLAGLNGTCAGGGYELAMACDEIVLIDDGNSAVSLPETPLLAVLPGTGGLTRLVDKRKVRRDLADIFCTTAEGVKGRRAKAWGLVDHVATKSRFNDVLTERSQALVDASPGRAEQGIEWTPLDKTIEDDGDLTYGHVSVTLDRGQRMATLTVRAPEEAGPTDADAIREAGASWWPLAAFRELDDALCHLRINEAEIGLVLLKTEGSLDIVESIDAVLDDLKDDWLVGETRSFIARTLRRLDLTAKSFYALVEPGSCFVGTLFELALAADRSYMLDDPDADSWVGLTAMNAGAYPMSHDKSRMDVRYFADPEKAAELLAGPRRFDPAESEDEGLVTVTADDIDYEDEVRIAIEERLAMSPDALTGMEASLRFPGAETTDSKIFGRLTAWQNWIFQRPNAVGEKGALTLYGRPERPDFDYRRT
ncbi:MAG: 2,3-epoxybenzoyl-CoA dihydrolase [Planctomycetota bacterium]|nr:2,3-epoxybenzoyl-CoA dihydrolase [Planctomycetota bacterium]